MIRVELIAIRIRWTVIPTVDNAVPIVIITDISEPVAILVRLIGIRDRHAIIERIAHTVSIRIGRLKERIRSYEWRGELFHAAIVGEVGRFARGIYE